MMSESKHPALFILGLLLVLAGANASVSGADDEAAPPPIVGVVPIGQQAMEPRDEASKPVEQLPEATTVTQGIAVSATAALQSTVFAPTFVRLEQDDVDWSLTGSWASVSLTPASGGTYTRSASAGDTAQIGFSGTWVSIGLVADRFSGEVEILLDGVSQGVFDLYQREETPVQLHFDGLTNAAHTVSLSVTGTANSLAANTRVQLDYTDYGDGTLLPDGDFEEDDQRTLVSDGWTAVTYASASGGQYYRSTTGSAWFPFAGDSFSLQTLAYGSAGRVKLFVDGVPLDIIDLYEPVLFNAAVPKVFSYQGFGAGDHVLQVLSYQDTATIDRISTPGSAPFIDPDAAVSGVARVEADDPALLFNGLPYTHSADSWVRVANINTTLASAGEVIYSAAQDDAVQYSFDGDWLGIGFIADRFGGQAEIAIDGVVVETVDLYSRATDTLSLYYSGIGPGAHSVTVTALGTASPESSGTRMTLDYFEAWDGQPLADGAFEDVDTRVIYSRGWSRLASAAASGGTYMATGIAPATTAWLAFTGDSVTWQGWTRFKYQDVEIRIDGVSQGLKDLFDQNEGPRAFSFDGLGAGPHVLEIRQVRGDAASVDVITTPAVAPPDPAPAIPAIVRHEENHPALRYNGQPYATRAQSWAEFSDLQVSRGYYASSSTADDRWQLDFNGQWIALGFRSTATSGSVEVFIDGVSQGGFDTSGGINEVKQLTFGGLAPGAHSVEAVVETGPVMPDFIDIWDGQPVNDGWYDARLDDAPPGLIHLSRREWWRDQADEYAREDNVLSPFVSSDTNAWFNFTGTDLTVLAYQRENTVLQVVIDGVDQGLFNLSPTAPFRAQPTALYFTDLGEGPHAVQVALDSNGGDTPLLDAFEVDPEDTFAYTPEVEWFDTTAQESLPGTSAAGFVSTVAVGDLDGDGVVELVAPAQNGRLYVYRGDGQDAGSGSPIKWTSDLVGPAAEPALADLDGDGRAEIIVSGRDGTFAFRHDGQLLWSNPTVQSYLASQEVAWGGPSVANLDLDPEPEIVISALGDAIYVLDHLGNVVFSDPLGSDFPTVPVLADLTGDGVLDIVVAETWTLKVIDVFNGGTLAWSRELPDPIVVIGGAGAFGGPAIADLNNDGNAEVIINWGHVIEALEDDGTLLWRYPTNRTDLYRPSPVTVADVTGDGQPNLVTASAINAGLVVNDHLLMVLDASGSLVWEQGVADNSASASGVAAQDLTGNGAWEIIWNGATDGFLVLNGADGERLFNEPYTGSGTVLDYPSLADVDGDGQAEVVVAGANGLFVIGHTGRWVDSRPVWNQHNYHINNINNDWSLPFTEENSWEAHNTYRTQTPDRDPGCVLANGIPVPPRIIELSPEAGALLPSAVPLVISGRIIPVGPAQPLQDVLIDGSPVDLLDASGTFFTVVALDAGVNTFEIRAQDGCAEALLTLSLNGGSDGDDPWADLADASVLLESRFAATSFDINNNRLLVDVQADNDGPSVPGPVLMTVGNDIDTAVGLLNADGFTPQGEPYVVVIPEGETLAAGNLSAARELAFFNSERRPIDFTPRWIAPVNQPPYFTSAPVNRATAGQPWTYNVGVADGNGDSVSLSLDSAPTGMLLQDGRLSWTPAITGNFEVIIAADDGRGATASQGFAVRVEDGAFNSPPVFTTSPPTQSPIGAVYAYAALASDLDGDTLGFSLQAAPAGVTVDPATGAVTWAAAEPGQHSVVLLADDGRGGRASQAWTLYVGEPALTSPGPAFSSMPTTYAAVGVKYRYAWRVTTSLAQAPVVSLVQAPARMTLDPMTAELTWVPGGPDLGTHVVELLAVDAIGQEALQRFELQVLPELPNQSPYFVSAPDLTARIASPYAYDPEAIDPEFEALSWTLATAPAGMTINPNNGAITWLPNDSQPSEVPVSVQAEDPQGGVASQAFTIRLRGANVPPQITTAPPTSVVVGAFYSSRILATDGDGDARTYRLLIGPTGMTLHASLGWLHWVTTGGTPGTYPVTLEVTDGWGGQDELAFDLELLSDDQLPQVAIRATREPACRGEAVSICVDASDNVGLASVGLSIDGSTRALDTSSCHLWTPADSGIYPAQADAVDPSGQSAQASASLTVADCNDELAPVVTLVSPVAGSTHDQPVAIVASIEDNTPVALSWTVTLRNAKTGASEVIATGNGTVTNAEVAQFDPTMVQHGDYFIDIQAEDVAQSGGIAVPLAAGTGAKPGRLAFTLQDLAWQLGTFPLVIGRAYDSLDAGPLGESGGDFGPGWRLVLGGSVTDSAVDAPAGSSGFAAFAAEPFTNQTRVNVTKPDGERVGFTFDPQPKSFPALFQFDVQFKPDPDVTDMLRAIDGPSTVTQLGAGFADYVIPYNPSLYELETKEGFIYVLSEVNGLIEVRDPQGGVLTTDINGWQSSWGARVDYQRNPARQITAIVLIDEDGSSEITRVSYGYDNQGRLASMTDIGGGVSRYEYGDTAHPNHVTRTLDALGNPVAQMVFDNQGRMIAHCSSDGDLATLGGCTLFEFTTGGGAETIFDPRGFRIDRFYDENGLLSARHDYFDTNQFVEQRWTYDDDGNIVEYRDRDGGITTSEYDENGNKVRLVLPDGSETTWEYGDCGSDWIRQCDALANCTTRTFDQVCRIVSQTDPVGGTRRVEYDARGFVQRMIDEEQQARTFTYDARGQLVQSVDNLGQVLQYQYDPLGQLSQVVDRNGDQREFIFDSAFRLIEERRPGEGSVATWTYNELNQIAAASKDGSTLSYTYDRSNRVTRVEHEWPGDPGWWVEYDYDASGNVTRVVDSAGGITEYEYDGIDRLVSIRQSGTDVIDKRVDIESSPAGLPLVIRRYEGLDGNVPGPVTTYTYGCTGCPTRLTSITHRQAGGTLIREISYTRNALGQVVELTDIDGVHRYNWDGRGWLNDEQHPVASVLPSGSTSWDGVGNWLSNPSTPGPAALSYMEGSAGHRLLDVGTFSYSYSGEGQLVARVDGSGERLNLDYSPEHRIRSVSVENGSGQTVTSATYLHALTGWRVRGEHDGVVRHYVHDFDNPILALDSNGDPVWRRLHGRVIDRPFAIERSGQVNWLLTDSVGTVLAETSTQGQILAEYRYDAFGRQVGGPAPALDDSLRFSGRDFDLPGGLGYFRARVYDPGIGRFVSEDPQARWLYHYGENNPFLFIDPMGESAALEYALFICDVAGLAFSYQPIGLNVSAAIDSAAAVIAGSSSSASGNAYGMIPAPQAPPDAGENAAAGEILKGIGIACGATSQL